MTHTELSPNRRGRDLIVGDLHGHIGARLRDELDARGFDTSRDRLISVGDLVDRGPDSHLLADLLAQPWFHAVRGNHEQMLIDYHDGVIDSTFYSINGGAWAVGMTPAERLPLVDAARELPLCITLGTRSHGLVGIVHAMVPQGLDWADTLGALEIGAMGVSETLLWGRGGWGAVPGVRAVVCGHTVVGGPSMVGNHILIDTGGWMTRARGIFTFIDAETLQVVEPQRPLSGAKA